MFSTVKCLYLYRVLLEALQHQLSKKGVFFFLGVGEKQGLGFSGGLKKNETKEHPFLSIPFLASTSPIPP